MNSQERFENYQNSKITIWRRRFWAAMYWSGLWSAPMLLPKLSDRMNNNAMQARLDIDGPPLIKELYMGTTLQNFSLSVDGNETVARHPGDK